MPTLYVVATPIGNLSELSPRAAQALGSAGLILAEDTRVTAKLLAHLNLRVPTLSNHRHNEREQAEQIAQRILREGIDAALVSDAGTPGVSDPGWALVNAAIEAGIEVVPIAGPSAIAAALSVSGFEIAEYAFYSFLPRESGPRDKAIARIAAGPRVAVLFESPHRVIPLVSAIERLLPDARLCLCCDLTKRYELILRGLASEVRGALETNPKAEKGEYVLAMDLSACPLPEQEERRSPQAAVLEGLLQGLDFKQAQARAVQLGISRNEAYGAALQIRAWMKENRP